MQELESRTNQFDLICIVWSSGAKGHNCLDYLPKSSEFCDAWCPDVSDSHSHSAREVLSD